MTSRRTCDLPHVDCIVIDGNTLRYGGSVFVRERKCRNVYGNDHDLFGCSECDDCYDQTGVVGGFKFCPACGAKVVA